MSWDTLVIIGVLAIVITLLWDAYGPRSLKEGFLIGPGENMFVTAYFPRRGDIGFQDEQSGFIRDKRNVMGYADVQALSVNHDFCRMVIPKGGNNEKDRFFACALGGTENLSSVSYRTQSVRQGFQTSRDDYMRDVEGDRRMDYCAIIKVPGRGWEPRCYRALETGFDTRTIVDTDPPKDIKEVLYFYEGILFWFRLIDDLKDYAENLDVYRAGDITINEVEVKPLPSQVMDEDKLTKLDDRIQITNGLTFNGSNQYLRLGDSPEMTFGRKVALATLKAVCFWVKFDQFTNNAHIIDFGNGAGDYNYFIGIIGKGDSTMDDASELRSLGCLTDAASVLPDCPSGAKRAPVMSPQELMKTTDANVDEFTCPNAQVLPKKIEPIRPLNKRNSSLPPKTATLVYEIWNGKQRLQHLKVQQAFKLKTWTHVCITTASSDGVRPSVQVWVDGVKVADDPNGYLPQTSFTTNNYIGKSNWINETSKYENKAELFKGSLFDLRGYSQSITQDKLRKTIRWGKLRLGIK